MTTDMLEMMAAAANSMNALDIEGMQPIHEELLSWIVEIRKRALASLNSAQIPEYDSISISCYATTLTA